MTLLVKSTAYLYSQLTEKDRLQTEILAAIKFHRIDQVKNLSVSCLNLGGDIDFQNDDGSPPLMLATCF